MPSTTSIQFVIEAPNTRWIGFGYGSSMTNTDMFTIILSGTWTITDRYSTGNSLPSADTTNHYTLSTSTGASKNTYTVSRSLNTGDAQDYSIPDGRTNMIYAYGSGTTIGYHGNGNYGALAINVDSANRVVTIEGGTIDYSTDNALIHGLILYMAWGLLSVLLIISGRYSKYFYFLRTYVHGIIGLLTLILTVIAILGFGESDRPRESINKLGNSHVKLGRAVVYWMIVAAVMGIATKASDYFSKHKTYMSYYLRYIHLTLTWLLIIYSQIVLLSGMHYFDSPVTYLFYIHLALMVFLLICSEFIFRFKLIWKYNMIVEFEDKDLPIMTEEEFIKSKDKLAIFENYVIKISGYFFDHPGGKYVLQECVGKDIGKYLNGSYSMESNMSPHTHSVIAYKILQKLAVAKLKMPESHTSLFIEKTDQSVMEDVQMNNKNFRFSSLIFRVKEKEEITPGVFRVKFHND